MKAIFRQLLHREKERKLKKCYFRPSDFEKGPLSDDEVLISSSILELNIFLSQQRFP